MAMRRGLAVPPIVGAGFTLSVCPEAATARGTDTGAVMLSGEMCSPLQWHLR
jgi:hypothetical protein